MQLEVLGCQGGSAPARHLPGLLLDGTVLLEAGSVTSPCASHAERPRPKGRFLVMDVLYIGLIVGFLALSWGLVELCDRL